VTARKAYDEPTTVTATDGEVTLDGPDGVAVSMTPDAAATTGQRLSDAAEEARRQIARETAEEDEEV
jgi:hypothetical protein